MQIFEYDLSNFPRDDNSVVTVGTFDGLHLGHQDLISRVVKGGYPSVVVTFYPHPQKVVARPGNEVKILTPPEEKVTWMENLDVERLVVLNFNRDLLNMTTEDFLKHTLIERIGLKKMVIGYDHAFGKSRGGNIEFLEKKSREYDFELEVVKPYYHNDKIVSSTGIRRAIARGEVDIAAEMLGRNYTFWGWVIKGDCRGATLGYPTANLRVTPDYKMLPGNGVYVVFASIEGKRYPALLYIGNRPTYGFGELSVEVFLLDFKGYLYGERLVIEMIKRLRGDIAFKNQDELINQMHADEKLGREIIDSL